LGTGSTRYVTRRHDALCVRMEAEMIKHQRQARVSKSARETAEVVALLRELRGKMRIVEEVEPDNDMLQEYQNWCGRTIMDLRRIRGCTEFELRRRDISARERKAATVDLCLIALVESEFESSGDTAH
jgi:hypothetical protein